MTDELNRILESLRAGLAGLPEDSIRRAIEYYGEYFADAREAGRSEEETLARLGGVKEIAAHVRAEAALSGAEFRPGPVRLTGALRRVLRGLAGSAARAAGASLALGAACSYVLAIGVYFLALAAFAGALATAGLVGWGLQGMPAADVPSRLSFAGAGLLVAAASVALGLALWATAGAVARVTLGVLRRGLRGKRKGSDRPVQASRRKKGLMIAFLVCGLAAALGTTGFFLSDLPFRLFSIWNSMKPADLAAREWTYAPGKVREIEIRTMNSSIVFETATAGEGLIRITREEPKWLSGVPLLEKGRLSFREVSSGTLPFMDFIARHEGMTEVRIAVPRGFSARSVSLASGSGAVTVSGDAGAIRAVTDSGAIRFTSTGSGRRLRAAAPPGRITVRGKPLPVGIHESGSGPGIELVTGGGTITID